MFASGNQTARARYLQALLAHYGTIAIPIGSCEQQISLETVFQPLALHHRSLAPVEDERESQADTVAQQTPKDQQSSQEQTVVARDVAEALQKSSGRRQRSKAAPVPDRLPGAQPACLVCDGRVWHDPNGDGDRLQFGSADRRDSPRLLA